MSDWDDEFDDELEEYEFEDDDDWLDPESEDVDVFYADEDW